MINSPSTVTVCIGTYNREKFVRECIDSVLAQTRPADEIIVVDDASTDGTVSLVKAYGDRVKLIERSINSGNCAAARNDAMRAATGDLIAFLDSDDAWLPTKLEQQVAYMERHPGVSLCHTYCEVMDGDSRSCGIRHEGRLDPSGDVFDWLMQHCWISTSTVLFRRSLLATVGYMNEDPRHRIGEDWEFFLRIAKDHQIGLVNEVLARYRKSGAGISTTNWRHTPRSVVSRLLILQEPSYWRGRIERDRVMDLLAEACHDSAIYWRDRGYPGRAIWFDSVWIRQRPGCSAAWADLARSLLPRVSSHHMASGGPS